MKKSTLMTLAGTLWIIACYAQQTVTTLDPMLTNYPYPFPVAYITIANQQQNLKMAFMDVKPQQPNGKTILLMHGKNFNGSYWAKTANALASQGYRVIIPDQIGFGKSSKPAHYHYTFQQLATNTKKLIDSLGIEKTSVLGHSMGGMLATRFTLMFADRVDKLILVNPIGLEDWKLYIPYQGVDKWYENELKQNYESIKAYQSQNYYDGKWKPEYEEWVKVLAGWTQHEAYPTIAWNNALTHDMIYTQPVVYEFPNIKVPTLLVIGQRDRTAPGKNLVDEETRKKLGDYHALGRETQRKIPAAELVELDNVGHLPHIEAFDRFIKPVLNFLKK